MSGQDELMRTLQPEVAQFVVLALRRLEQENIFDAPSVISGVLRQMRVADSALVRGAAGRIEFLLTRSFARGCLQRLSA